MVVLHPPGCFGNSVARQVPEIPLFGFFCILQTCLKFVLACSECSTNILAAARTVHQVSKLVFVFGTGIFGGGEPAITQQAYICHETS
jgi:hypothetical protein